MIPVSLTIKGIYSYQKEQTIDFTGLIKNKIFGIFGNVGSGKSTIIEAIIYALFESTSRLNQKEHSNIMNLKSKELLIDFVFSTNEGKFKSIITAKRNKNKFENVNYEKKRLFKEINGDWIPEERLIEDIIGLSYENFTKIIIIPQGKFAEFLTLTPNNRTSMLNEIFGLRKYDLFDKVKKLDNENNLLKENLSGKLSELGDISDDVFEVFEKRLTELYDIIKHDESSINDLEKELGILNINKNLFEQLDREKQKLESLIEKNDYYKNKDQKVKEFEKCYNEFKNLIDKEIELKKETDDKKHLLSEKENNLHNLLSEQKTMESGFEKLKFAYENRSELNAKISELNSVLELTKHNALFNQKTLENESLLKLINDIIANLDRETSKYETIKSGLNSLKEKSPDISMLSDIKNWFILKKNLESRFETENNELSQINNELKILYESKENIYEKIKTFNFPKTDVLKSINEFISKTITANQEINEKLGQLKLGSKLKDYSDGLKDGIKCPLCGSLTHPDILNIEDNEKKIAQTCELIKTNESAIEMLRNIKDELQSIQNNIENADRLVSGLKTKINITNQNLMENRNLFCWDEKFLNEKTINDFFIQANDSKKNITNLEKERETVESNIANLNKALNDKKIKHTESANIMANLKGKIESQSGNINLIDINDYRGKNTAEINNEIEKLKISMQNLEEDFKKQSGLSENINKSINLLSGEITGLKNTINDLMAKNNNLQTEISRKIKNSGFASFDIIKKILSVNPDIENEKKDIENYFRNLHSSNEIVNTLSQNLKGQSFDEHIFEEKNTDLKLKKIKLSDLKNEEHLTKNKFADAKNKFEKVKNLKAQYEELENKEQELKILRNLFSGQGFVNYISGIYLSEVCNLANDRFSKLTNNHLKLELDSENNFLVRDFLNNGEVRSVKTLSGGQMFQASLSLALALSDKIQRQISSDENFFFIDEGFGSLDKDSLAYVFDTLKNLRKENRIVGIISHVEEIQNQIDDYVRVENDRENGSLIV